MANVSSTVLLKPLIVSLFTAAALGGATAVFGDGGHNPVDDTPLPVEDGQVALNHQLIENAIASEDITEDDDGNVMVTGRLSQADLVGETISEFGIKIGSNLIGIRNSAPKIKQADEEFETKITFIF